MFHRLLALPLAAFLLAGCAATVSTQVTSFHQLSSGLQGQRFVILPTAEQQNSLEFNSYAALVREALVGKGLVDAAGARAADLGVVMTYSVSGRNSGLRDGTGVYGGFGAGSGGGFSMGGVGIGIGFPIGGGGGSDANAYVHNLKVEINRLNAGAAAAAPAATGTQETSGAERVYEARATSEGPSASPAPIMRAMVQAIFEDFPGENGRTRVVRAPLPESSPSP
jgi:hypothetical protein